MFRIKKKKKKVKATETFLKCFDSVNFRESHPKNKSSDLDQQMKIVWVFLTPCMLGYNTLYKI